MDLVFTPDGDCDVISNRGRDGAVIAAKLVVAALGEP